MYYIYGHFLDGKCIYIGSNCMSMRADRAYDLHNRNEDYAKLTKNRKQDIEVKILKEFPNIPYSKGLNGIIQSEEVKMIVKYHDIGEALCSHQDLRGRHHSEETKKKISDKNKGRKFTEEHKHNISKNHADISGKNNPMYGKITWNKGKHLSDEHKAKISKSNRLQCRLEHNGFIIECDYSDLMKYCKLHYNMGSSLFKKWLNIQQPFIPNCNKHNKAEGLILKRL